MIIKSNKSGFTLVELLVVLGVFAIMATIAVPTINTWLPKWRLSSAARQIGSACQNARMKSATSTTEYRVAINDSVAPYSIQIEKGNAPTGSTVWTCEEKNYSEFHSEINFNSITPAATLGSMTICRPDGSAPTTNGYLLIFKPNGATTATAAFKVQLSNSQGTQFEVTISNTTGRVKVDKGWTP